MTDNATRLEVRDLAKMLIDLHPRGASVDAAEAGVLDDAQAIEAVLSRQNNRGRPRKSEQAAEPDVLNEVKVVDLEAFKALSSAEQVALIGELVVNGGKGVHDAETSFLAPLLPVFFVIRDGTTSRYWRDVYGATHPPLICLYLSSDRMYSLFF